MLSVGGSGTRSRSKSPGRRDERDRSRSRDLRAPSPARRAPSPAVVAPPPIAKPSRGYYEEDEDDALVSDSEDRRHGYTRTAEHAHAIVRRAKSRFHDDDDDDDDDDEDEDGDGIAYEYDDQRRQTHSGRHDEHDRASRYATEEEMRARSQAYRADERSRNKEYAMPGQFEEEDMKSRKKDQRQERPNGHPRAASYSMGGTQYEKLPQYQYEPVNPKEIRYAVSGKPPYTRTPSDQGPVYTRNPAAQITVASSTGRHARKQSRDDRGTSDKYGRDDRRTASMRELERLEQEKEDRRREDEARRRLEQLRREKEEHEELERKQRRKSVQIKDARERDRDYHEIKPKYDRRGEKYSDDEYDNRRDDRYAEGYDQHRDSRRQHDEDSDDSDEEEQLDRLYHAKYREDDRYDDRRGDKRRERDDRRSDKDEKRRDRPETSRRQSDGKHQVVEIHPGSRGPPPPSSGLGSRTRGLSVGTHTPGALTLAAPGAGGHVRRGSVGAPPGSPLLESYRGTYQSISPMPSPMALAHHPDDSDLSDFELATVKRKKKRSSEEDTDSEERRDRKPKSILKRAKELGVRTYDPEPDALALAKELKGSHPAPEILIQILPTLSNDSISLLRTEYKKHAKIQGKGINIAKHIKLKVGNTNLGKAAYACALGRWESEAQWANFWYQSGSSRRELLIESLFGRSNDEVRAIKDAFTDKRYGDSLVKCMESELKKDKFRVAVLKALEAKKDEHPEVSRKQVEKDVKELHKALISKDGGESAMLNIIVTRDDEHLRAILREYEQEYEKSFAREMTKRSQNLVGETLAHILHGATNRPVRDALLLRQAIAETSKDRADLIISRLTRLHWEPKHLARVKVEYARRYNAELEYDIEDATKGDFSAFCVMLCRGAVR